MAIYGYGHYGVPIPVPNRSNYTGRIACLDCERESMPEKRPGSIFLVEHAQFFTQVLQERGRSDSSLNFKG